MYLNKKKKIVKYLWSQKSAKCIFLIYLLPCGSCKLSIQDSALDDKKSE